MNNIWNLLAILFVFLFVDTFDTVGTLTGVGVKALGTSTVATFLEIGA